MLLSVSPTPVDPLDCEEPLSGEVTPLWKTIRNNFFRNRMGIVGLVFLAVISFCAAFSTPLTALLGVDPNTQDVSHRFAPPLSSGEEPRQVQEQRLTTWLSQDLARSKSLTQELRALKVVDEAIPDEDAPYDVLAHRADPDVDAALKTSASPLVNDFLREIQGKGVMHLLGTDELGRDVLARLLSGAQVSLMVAVLTGLMAGGIGTTLGLLAGYLGGWTDTILMRISDGLLAIPLIPLLILMAAVDLKKLFGDVHLGASESITKMVVIITLLSWVPVAKLVRGTTLSLRDSEYILAAKTVGVKPMGILYRHLFPNILGTLSVAVTNATGQAMISETVLSFFGMGIQPPRASWGNMLQNAQELVTYFPLLAILPGLFIFLSVLSINFVGDGLRDAFDPRLKQR